MDFRLRGEPVAGRLRGVSPGGGRLPGRRGPNPRQRLPGHRQRPRDCLRSSTRSIFPAAEPDRIRGQIEEVIGLDASEALEISAKTGPWHRQRSSKPSSKSLPPPSGNPDAPLKAMLIDSWYDARISGVVDPCPRSIDGSLKTRPDASSMMQHRRHAPGGQGRRLHPENAGARRAGPRRDRLSSSPASKRWPTPAVGDTITDEQKARLRAPPRLPPRRPGGLLRPLPHRRRRISKIFAPPWASSASTTRRFSFEMETSAALGFGFRCGFLGLLHLRDHPGASGARVQPRPHRHRPLGGLHSLTLSDGSRDPRPPQPGRHARPHPDRGDRRALDQGHDPHPRRISRRHFKTVPRAPRHPNRAVVRRLPRAW